MPILRPPMLISQINRMPQMFLLKWHGKISPHLWLPTAYFSISFFPSISAFLLKLRLNFSEK
jgi:hypothetical protein